MAGRQCRLSISLGTKGRSPKRSSSPSSDYSVRSSLHDVTTPSDTFYHHRILVGRRNARRESRACLCIYLCCNKKGRIMAVMLKVSVARKSRWRPWRPPTFPTRLFLLRLFMPFFFHPDSHASHVPFPSLSLSPSSPFLFSRRCIAGSKVAKTGKVPHLGVSSLSRN